MWSCVQGPAPALQSYLNIDAIIDAVKKTGARAVSHCSRQMSSAGRRAALAASYDSRAGVRRTRAMAERAQQHAVSHGHKQLVCSLAVTKM
jgi:hypothetical protein